MVLNQVSHVLYKYTRNHRKLICKLVCRVNFRFFTVPCTTNREYIAMIDMHALNNTVLKYMLKILTVTKEIDNSTTIMKDLNVHISETDRPSRLILAYSQSTKCKDSLSY